MGTRQHTPNDIHIQGDTAWMVLTNRAGFPVAVTLIDAADVPLIRSWRIRWCAVWHEKTHSYRVLGSEWRDGKSHNIYLHRRLIQPLPGMDTDHINHNTLDNRRKNLRPATRQMNAQNYRPGAYDCLRKPKPPKISPPPKLPNPYRYEATFDPQRNRWRARVVIRGRRLRCGNFLTKEEAVQAAEARLVEYRALDRAA